MDEARIQVLIVDDHQLVIDGINSLLKQERDIVCAGTARSAREAISLLQAKHIDVVLLDISMPGEDGIQACQRIKKRHPSVQVIALTMLEERAMIKAMILAGADGYLLKNVNRDELILAIRRVRAGKTHYSPEIAGILLREEIKEEPEAIFPALSRREKQILQLIIDECTTADIAGKLNISTNTVETHRRNIMHKLGAKNTAGIVRIALEQKLLD